MSIEIIGKLRRGNPTNKMMINDRLAYLQYDFRQRMWEGWFDDDHGMTYVAPSLNEIITDMEDNT